MSSEEPPPWSVAPPTYLNASLVNGDDKRIYKLDKPGVKAHRLGRMSTCDIQIEHQTASRSHAIIAHHKDGGVFLIDLKSANGTFINGKMIGPNALIKLQGGDILKFGDCPTEFRVELKDLRENAKKDMISQLTGYSDGDETESAESRTGNRNAVSRDATSNFERRERDEDRRPESRDRRDNQARGGYNRDNINDRNQPQGNSFARSANDRGFSANPHPPSGKPAPAVPHAPTGSGVSDVAQKRKMLWGSKAKEDSSKNTATWSTLSTTLGSSEAQDKFLKLMGGKKPGNEADAAAPVHTDVNYGTMQHELEREYTAALYRTQGHNKHGLG